MPKFTVYALTPYTTWEGVEAESEKDAIKKVQSDPGLDCYDCNDGPMYFEAVCEDDDKEEKKKMDYETLEALKGSITKWEKILAHEVEDDGPINCPLCVKFNTITNELGICGGCPVREKTGDCFCGGSPYEGWVKHQEDEHERRSARTIYCDVCRDFAQKEVNFLKRLLPKKD